jgi:hypothetical protein
MVLSSSANDLLKQWIEVISHCREEGKKEIQSTYEKRVKQMLLQIDSDTGTCMGYVSEAVGSIEPILKLMLVSSSSNRADK